LAPVPRSPGKTCHSAIGSIRLADAFLRDQIFHQAQITGGTENQRALIAGQLGSRFSFDFFESNLAAQSKAAVASTLDASADTGDRVGSLQGATAINASTIIVDGLTDTQTIEVGATFKIAGDPTVYTAITGSDTTVATATLNLTISPALRQSHVDNAVVTFELLTAVQEAAHEVSLAYHRDALALVMVNLPSSRPGAEVGVAVDPESGLSVRFRRFYDGHTTQLFVAYDAAYGVAVLNPMMAARIHRAAA
jgi:hypothetical protein